jgi:outer membrane protein TolC
MRFCRDKVRYATSAKALLALYVFWALPGEIYCAPQAKADSSLVKPTAPDSYKELLTHLDIYAPPAGATKLISLPELYQLVQSRGLALKLSRESFNAAKQSVKTENDKKIPVLSLDMSHDQTWSKTLGDSDTTDNYADRKSETNSRNLNSKAGLSLNGSPVRGVSYKVLFPQLAHSQTMPDTQNANPPRRDSAAFTAGLDVSLLRDNPFSSESLARRKSSLTLAAARETLRKDVIAAIGDAESAFFGLIQKYLQLSVQQRSLLLARALEKDVKEKISAGEASSLEATRSELQTAQAETDYMSSEIDYEAALAEFRNSLAFDDADGAGIFPDPKSLNIDVESFTVPNDAIKQISAANPAIGSARLAKELADIDLKLARVSTLPNLAFGVNYGNTAPGDGWGQTTRESLRPNDRVFSMGLTYSQILFNDTSRNSLEQAVVASQKAALAEDDARRSSEKEFNALLKRMDIGSRRYRIAKVSREIAEKKLKSEYERFKAGESSVRNVIDSQTEVNSARISEISARVDMLSSIGKMRALLGRMPDDSSAKTIK